MAVPLKVSEECAGGESWCWFLQTMDASPKPKRQKLLDPFQLSVSLQIPSGEPITMLAVTAPASIVRWSLLVVPWHIGFFRLCYLCR